MIGILAGTSGSSYPIGIAISGTPRASGSEKKEFGSIGQNEVLQVFALICRQPD
jgi:hypothetical protein